LAREHLHEAEKEFLTLLKQWPDDPGIHTALGTCYYNLAQLDLLDGKSSDYYEYLDKAAAEFQTYFDGSEKNLDMKYIGLMVNVCHDMGNSYLHDQQPDHALSWYEKCESVHKLLPSDIATTDTYDARIADLYARWSDALRTAGQITEAITKCKRSLTNWKKLIVLHPDTSMYSRNYAVTLGRLARIQMELNDRRSAKENLLKAKRELSRLVQAHPGQSEFQAPLHEILVFLHQLEQ
jgi:tetratricopeptide (TPR) repeat protein